jgi:hypothetical protein
MKLHRRLVLRRWDEGTAQLGVDYLRSHKFSDARLSAGSFGPVVTGTRGSWLGSLASFDAAKLRTKVQLTGEGLRVVDIGLEVNTFGQWITEWNAAVLRLELVELRRVLIGREPVDEVWARLVPACRAAAIRQVLGAAFGAAAGYELSEAWRAELRALERA